MSKLKPDAHFARVSDVPFSLLERFKAKAIFLDTDNTLAPRDSDEYPAKELGWLTQAKQRGYKLCIVSNGRPGRIKRSSKILGIPCFINPAFKPLPFGFLKAAKSFGLDPSECVMIGDQLFTDILGANLAGCKSILVDPVDAKTDAPWTKLMRKLEAKLLKPAIRSMLI